MVHSLRTRSEICSEIRSEIRSETCSLRSALRSSHGRESSAAVGGPDDGTLSNLQGSAHSTDECSSICRKDPQCYAWSMNGCTNIFNASNLKCTGYCIHYYGATQWKAVPNPTDSNPLDTLCYSDPLVPKLPATGTGAYESVGFGEACIPTGASTYEVPMPAYNVFEGHSRSQCAQKCDDDADCLGFTISGCNSNYIGDAAPDTIVAEVGTPRAPRWHA